MMDEPKATIKADPTKFNEEMNKAQENLAKFHSSEVQHIQREIERLRFQAGVDMVIILLLSTVIGWLFYRAGIW